MDESWPSPARRKACQLKTKKAMAAMPAQSTNDSNTTVSAAEGHGQRIPNRVRDCTPLRIVVGVLTAAFLETTIQRPRVKKSHQQFNNLRGLEGKGQVNSPDARSRDKYHLFSNEVVFERLRACAE